MTLSIEPLTDFEAAELTLRFARAERVISWVQDQEDADASTSERAARALEGIQAVLDHELLGEEDEESFEALGLLFGKLLADRVREMDWWMAEDEDGRDPVLRYRHTDFLIFPADLLAAQLEDDGEADISAFFHALRRRVEEIALEHYRPH